MQRPLFAQAVFGANCFVAAMLALYIGLSIGLPRPYWAMTTVYIVSQPLSGALRSKAVYRTLGTLLGATAAVTMVPRLADAPELLSLALALWVGLCLFVALLDRTPRSYVLMLAGYTAAIIGFPAVAAPAGVFDIALARVEEILLGIACATAVHMVIFPRSVAAALAARVDLWMADARAWTLDMLAGTSTRQADRDRQRLAADATDVHLLSTHLPFDTSDLQGVAAVVRALQDRMVMLLPLATAVGDRLAAARRLGPLGPEWERLLEEVSAWLRAGPDTTTQQAREVRRRIAETAGARAGEGWRQMLLDNLADRLGALVDHHQDCRELRRAFRGGATRPPPGLASAAAPRADRPLHRDVLLALLSGAAAAIATLICCGIWIDLAWPEGAVAALTAAVFCSFFATRDDPAPGIVNFMVFTLASMPLVGIYLFVILPWLQDFPGLVLVLAPALLPLGAAIARPDWYPWAMPLTLGIGNGLALQETFQPDLASFLNSDVAQMIGLAVAIIATRLFRSVGAEWSARRILRAAWRELADLARSQGQVDRTQFVGRMLDRLGLLTVRLALASPDDRIHAFDALADMRAGLNIRELNAVRAQLGSEAASAVGQVLEELDRHFRRRAPEDPAPPPRELLPAVDAAIGASAQEEDRNPAARRSVIALVGLRRNLFPAVDAFPAAAA